MRNQYPRLNYFMTMLIGLGFMSNSTIAQISNPSHLYKSGLAATCANCHGTNGGGVEGASIPLINIFTSEQMLTQLQAYKNGSREGTIMPQLMKGYTDEQLQTIALQLGKKQ
jgi:cytochrome c553